MATWFISRTQAISMLMGITETFRTFLRITSPPAAKATFRGSSHAVLEQIWMAVVHLHCLRLGRKEMSGCVNSDAASGSAFGTSTSTQIPRQGQIGARVEF